MRKIIIFSLLVLLLSPYSVLATVNLYVDTDTGNNSNNGSSWALAKADSYHCLVFFNGASLADDYIVNYRGATADTQTAIVYPATMNGHSITLKGNSTSGVWDSTKYHMAMTNATAISINTPGTVNIYNLQVSITNTGSGSGPHCIVTYTGSGPSTANIAYNIIQGAEGSNITDAYAIHSGTIGSGNALNAWNNVISGFTNANDVLTMGAIAHYCSGFVMNNTFYNNRTGIYNGVASVNKVLAINNLFVSVPNPLTGNSPSGTYASGTDYNATDQAALLTGSQTVTGGDGTHEQLNVSTANLFLNAGTDFHLTASSSSQVRGAGGTDPSSGVFLDDITGLARTVPWDIGAFKYTSSGNSVTIGAGSQSISMGAGSNTLTIQ